VGTGAAAAELRTYLDAVVPGYRAEWGTDESFEAALAWQRLLADGGWAAPSWPVWAGGRGLDVVDRVQCDTELAAVDAPMPAGVLGLNNVGPALILFGDEAQRASLPRILTGEEIWCQGFSEPGAGSDLAGLSTRAVITEDGFLVNGQKVWTSQGMQGTHVMLLVRTDPAAPKHKGISVLLVPMDAPGVERRPLRQITGESEFAEVFFTDVRVPRSALLGPLHDGWRVTMATLGYERSGVISMAAALQREVEVLVQGLRIDDPLLRDEVVCRWMDARLTGLLGARARCAGRRREAGGRAVGDQGGVEPDDLRAGGDAAAGPGRRRPARRQPRRAPIPAQPSVDDRGGYDRDHEEPPRRAGARPTEGLISWVVRPPDPRAYRSRLLAMIVLRTSLVPP
jgi:alkylation response protein AidB-like acyl-CoA dehydrogenase